MANISVDYIGGAASGMKVYTSGQSPLVTYTSQYPPAHNSTYVKATSFVSDLWYPWYVTNPAISVTGAWGNTSWGAVGPPQSLHIDLGSGKVIKRIYYEPNHDNGWPGDNNSNECPTTSGAKDFTFWGSNTSGSFDDTDPTHDTNWTELTTSTNRFVCHPALNIAYPQYVLVTNATAYRYYRIKVTTVWPSELITLRRVELQTQD